MSILFILIPLSLIMSTIAFFAFVKTAHDGQLDVENEIINNLLEVKGKKDEAN